MDQERLKSKGLDRKIEGVKGWIETREVKK